MGRYKIEPWQRTVKCINGPLDGEYRYIPPSWTAFSVPTAHVRAQIIRDTSGYYQVRPMNVHYGLAMWIKYP